MELFNAVQMRGEERLERLFLQIPYLNNKSLGLRALHGEPITADSEQASGPSSRTCQQTFMSITTTIVK